MLNIHKYKEYIIKNRFSITVYVLIILLFILPKIPYVNLFFEYFGPVLFWAASILAIGRNAAALFRLSTIIFISLAVFTLFHEVRMSETIANGNYFILFTAAFLAFKDLLKEK